MKDWHPVSVIVVILAVTISINLTIATIAPVFTGNPLSDAKTELLADMYNEIMAVVTLFVGAAVQAWLSHKKGN